MNFVVLTAALSSLNAGLYSTGRILRSMAVNGSAPRFTEVMSRTGVPYGGILLTACITLAGVALNAFNPGQAFEIVLNMSAIGILGATVGIVWMIEGVVGLKLVSDAQSKVWTILLAIISILAWISLLTSPLWGAAFLWWLLGISLVVLGLVHIVRVFRFGPR